MLDRVNADLTALEQNVTKAEEELGYSNTGIKGFFKPFLGKIVKSDRSRAENADDAELTYQPVEAFKSVEYFGESSSSMQDDEDDTIVKK